MGTVKDILTPIKEEIIPEIPAEKIEPVPEIPLGTAGEFLKTKGIKPFEVPKSEEVLPIEEKPPIEEPELILKAAPPEMPEVKWTAKELKEYWGREIEWLQRKFPEKIDPLEYFRKGLSFGWGLDLPKVPPTTFRQKAFETAGWIGGAVLLQNILSPVFGGILKKIPGMAKPLEKVTQEAARRPWKVGLPLTAAKGAGWGAIFGAIEKPENKREWAKNILERAGTFAAFNVLAYPFIQFFRPVVYEIAKQKKYWADPNIRRMLATEGMETIYTPPKTLWFRHPTDPKIVLRVTSERVDVLPFQQAPAPVKTYPVLGKTEIEAFRYEPSLYARLKDWLKEIKFSEPVRPPPKGAPPAEVPTVEIKPPPVVKPTPPTIPVPEIPIIPSYTPYEKMNMIRTKAGVARLKLLYDLQKKGIEKVEIEGKIEPIKTVIKRTERQRGVSEVWEAKGLEAPEVKPTPPEVEVKPPKEVKPEEIKPAIKVITRKEPSMIEGAGKEQIVIKDHPEIYTDAYLLVEDRTPEEVKKWQERQKPSYKGPLEKEYSEIEKLYPKEETKPVRFITFEKPEVGVPIAHLDVGKDISMGINAEYYQWLKKEGYTIKVAVPADETKPLVLERNGKDVGLLAPMKDVGKPLKELGVEPKIEPKVEPTLPKGEVKPPEVKVKPEIKAIPKGEILKSHISDMAGNLRHAGDWEVISESPKQIKLKLIKIPDTIYGEITDYNDEIGKIIIIKKDRWGFERLDDKEFLFYPEQAGIPLSFKPIVPEIKPEIKKPPIPVVKKAISKGIQPSEISFGGEVRTPSITESAVTFRKVRETLSNLSAKTIPFSQETLKIPSSVLTQYGYLVDEVLSDINTKFSSLLTSYSKIIESVKPLDDILQKIAPTNQKSIDIKKPEDIVTKIIRKRIKGQTEYGLEDTRNGLRATIVVEAPAQVDEIKRLIYTKIPAKLKILKDQDFFKTPTEYGYRGRHFDIELPNGQKAELQFHTLKSLEVRKQLFTKYYNKWRNELEIPEKALIEANRLVNKIMGIERVPKVEVKPTPSEVEVKPEIKPVIPKELEPLAEEARKYKSAEEFIQNVKLYNIEVIPYIKKDIKYYEEELPALLRKTGDKLTPKSQKNIQKELIRLKNELRTLEKFKDEVEKRMTPEARALKETQIKQWARRDAIKQFLADFYNQAVKGVKEVKPEIKAIPKELEPFDKDFREIAQIWPEKFKGALETAKESKNLNEFQRKLTITEADKIKLAKPDLPPFLAFQHFYNQAVKGVKEIKPKAPPKPKLEEATPEKTPIKGLFVSDKQRKVLWAKAPHIAKVYSYGIRWGDLTKEQQEAVKKWVAQGKRGLPPEVPEPTKINKLYGEGVERARKRPIPPKMGLSLEIIASQAKQTQSPEIKIGLREQLRDKLNRLKEIIKPLQFYPDLPMQFRNAIRTEIISGLTKISDKVYNETYTALWGGLKEPEIAQSVELIYARDQLSRAKLGKGDPRITIEEAQKLVDKLEKEIFPEGLNAANRYRIIQEEYRQKLVDRKLLDPDQKIDDYAPHYVEDYTPNWVFKTGIPSRLRKPFRGYIKPARGTTKAYRKDADTILGHFTRIEKDNLIEDFIKKQASLYDKKADLTREEKIKLFGVDKAGRIRAPKPGRIYYIEGKRYRAYTPDIPFSRQVFPVSEGLMALGRYKKTYLLPENIYNAFKEFSERGNYGIFLANQLTGWWKTLAITSRFVPFNINNMIGDSWMLILQAPEPHRIIPELNTMLNYVRDPKRFPDFDKFLKDNGVLDAYFIKEIPHMGKVQNPIVYVLEKMRIISGFRENILRIAYASYLHKGYLKGEGEKLVKYHNWINTEGLTTEQALGKIARDILLDYGWVSKTFHRIIRGIIFPFGTWYFKGSHLVWKYTRRHLARALLFFLIMPVLSTLYNNRNKKIRELEQKLPDGIRDRIHFVIGENPDGTIRVWYAQLPQDMLIGTKIFSIAVNQVNMVINKEKTIKEATIDTLKRWGIKEAKGIQYLMMPMVRFLIGIMNQRDPYDGLPIYSIDPRRMTPGKRYWELFLYFQKTVLPFFGEFIYSITMGIEPIDLKKKEAIDIFIGLRALGILDINKKIQIRYFDEETEKEKFLEWEDYEKIQRLANQETAILAKIENDWINSGLLPEEFIITKEFESSILKIKELWIKHNPKAKELTIFEVATALDERLANSLGEDVVSAQRWLRVQLERAKTDEEKRKISEKYQKIREMKLIDSLKKLPKTAREIYLKAK